MTPGISADEWKVRVDLAAVFRLAAMQGWDEMMFANISARVPGEPNHLLMHPAHLLLEEVTASCLHKLDENCNHIVPSNEKTQKFGFPMHKAIYDARETAQCVIHLHTKATTAVAMQEQGLIPGNQYAMWLGPIGYHDYEGLNSSPEEGARVLESFGKGQIVLQKSHGFILWGRSVPEAYMLAFILNRACEVQLASLAGAIKSYVPPQHVLDITFQQAKSITEGTAPLNRMTWEALLRKLDREAPSYKS